MTLFIEQFPKSKLETMSVGIKDNIDIKGYATTCGSKAFERNRKVQENATVVDLLIDSGCHIAGKLNMHELAFGMTGVNHFTGTPVNFLYPDYIPGGSSSGSAIAAASEIVDFSIGTDTGGSIRVPAACCGVFGLKPTYGRVSRKGVIPAESSLDCVGPLSSSIEGIINAMSVIDETFVMPSSSIMDFKLGQVSVKVNPVIQKYIASFLNKLNSDIKNIELPTLRSSFDAALVIMNVEMFDTFGDLLCTGELGDDVKNRLMNAQEITQNQVERAKIIKDRFTDEVDAALENVDVLVLPTLPDFPLKREDALQGENDLNVSLLTRPFNLSGHPAIAIPLPNKLGKPMSIQLVGKKGDDEKICDIARIISGL